MYVSIMMTSVGLFLTITCAATVLDSGWTELERPHDQLRDMTGLYSEGVTGTGFLIPNPSEGTRIAYQICKTMKGKKTGYLTGMSNIVPRATFNRPG